MVTPSRLEHLFLSLISLLFSRSANQMDDLKALLDAEQEKVTKLKALVVKERKVNTKIKSELEYLKSLHTRTHQESGGSVEKFDKSCCTSEFSNGSTCMHEALPSELVSTSVENSVFNEHKRNFRVSTNDIDDKTTEYVTKIPVCIISASSSCETSSKDSLQSSDKHLHVPCLNETTIVPVNCLCVATQVDNLDNFDGKDSPLLQQFNTALQSLKLNNRSNLSKDELKLVFTECNRLLEEIDLCSTDNYHVPLNHFSSKGEIIKLENFCRTLPTDLNQYSHSLKQSFTKQKEEQNSCHNKLSNELKHVHSDEMCDEELHILEQRVNELKHSVEYAESSFNQLSNKLTSVTHINEVYNAKLLQLQTKYNDNSLDMTQSFVKLKSLLYDSFLLPLIKYHQEVNNNKQYNLNVDYFICDNFQDDTVSKVAKSLSDFLDELKQIIKHYYTFNNKCITSSNACIPTDYNETNIGQEKLLLDKLKSTESELINANEKILISENLISDLKSQLKNSDEKLHRMKNLLVKVKLDATEQQKKLLEFQKSQSVNVENNQELNRLTEKLSNTEKEKENLVCNLTQLRSELTQQHVLCENLQNDKCLALDRLQKLQNEYNAYKVKAQLALCNVRTVTNQVNTTDTNNSPNCEGVNTNQSDFESRSFYYSNELESMKHNLFDVQNRMKEAELHASLAQSECDLLKKELIEVKTRHTELLCQSQKQKQSLEDQLMSITQQCENRLSVEFKELEQKYTSQLRHYEERLMLQTQKYESELRQERELWETKLASIIHANHSPTQNSYRYEQTYGHRRNFSIPDNLNPLSANSHHKRVQGDGADNSMISPVESDTESDHAVRNCSLSQSGSEHYSLADEENYKKSVHRITIPTLEQLLNHPNQYSPSENMSSQHSVKSFQEVRNVQPNQLAGLQSALTNQQRRVEYLSELLSESETNVTRLFEQNKVLKEEIRRLENNSNPTLKVQCTENQDILESNNSLHSNTSVLVEHLKDILLKVITLPKQSSERNHLMRALATFLSLKSDEFKLLEEGLNHSVTCSTSNQQQNLSSNWSSYISAVWGQ
ncbi:unnamed protein product [Schistosoma intercalatum]|nr:unnamed protein product [Schistosoma intercalatum]